MKWLADYYLAEGPGIAKDAPKASGLMLVAQTMWREGFELMKLNLLFVLACLPVVTIPTALAALTRVTLTMAEDRNVYLVEDFTAAFRRHFVRASLLGIVFATLLAVPAYAAWTYGGMALANPLFSAPFVLALVVATLIAIAAAYAMALLAVSDFTLTRIVRLAFRAAIARPGQPLAALAFVAVLWLAHVLFYPVTLLMPAVVNFSFGALAVAFSVLETVNCLAGAPEERAGQAKQAKSGA